MPRPRRISRSLIGLLSIVIALGLVFWLKNLSSSRAQPAGQPPVNNTQSAVRPPAPRISNPAPTGNTVTQGPINTPAQPRPQPQPATRPATLAQNPPTPPALGPAAGILREARAKRDAGDLIAARTMLNDALVSNRLAPADLDSAKRLIGEINQSVFFSPQRFADDEFGGTYTVRSGELLRTIADRHDVPWELLARVNGISDPRRLRAGQNIKVVRGPFNAVVYKSRFMMDIYLGPPGEKGSLFVTSFPVGLGADDSTPTGTWMVETHKKLKNPTYFSPRGEGIIDADDPDNPLGERWIGLVGIDGHAIGKESYGIHGTIEPQSIGKMASMGCIRMHNQDVELVFDMLTEGKSIVIVKE